MRRLVSTQILTMTQTMNHKQYALRKRKQVIAPGAARRYALADRWQFDSRRIYVRPRTGPQSAHG